jgi:hypothetical protein
MSALENCADLFSVAVNQENMAGYTQSIFPMSPAAKKHMHVLNVNKSDLFLG